VIFPGFSTLREALTTDDDAAGTAIAELRGWQHSRGRRGATRRFADFEAPPDVARELLGLLSNADIVSRGRVSRLLAEWGPQESVVRELVELLLGSSDKPAVDHAMYVASAWLDSLSLREIVFRELGTERESAISINEFLSRRVAGTKTWPENGVAADLAELLTPKAADSKRVRAFQQLLLRWLCNSSTLWIEAI
jgi:hypothetical protein